MNTVESKYKNPDRFIRVLKTRIDFMSETARMDFERLVEERKKRGVRVMKWTPHEETQKSTVSYLAAFSPLDKVLIVGTVVEVSSRGGKSAMTYTVEETRRIGRESQ